MHAQYWVYILKCRDGSYYVGHTNEIDRRLSEHQLGLGGSYTATRRPVEIAWADWFSDRDQAFQFERRLKNWSRAKKLAFIQANWNELKRLAIPPGEREYRASLDFARDEDVLEVGSSRAKSRDD